MGETKHKPGDPWTCDTCENAFSTREELRKHRQLAHGAGRAKASSETRQPQRKESKRKSKGSVQDKPTSSAKQSLVPLPEPHSPEIPIPTSSGIRKKKLVSTGTQTAILKKKTAGTQTGLVLATHSQEASDSISVDSLSWMNEISSDSEAEPDPVIEPKCESLKRPREPSPRPSSSDSDGGNSDDDDDDDSSSYDSQKEWFPPEVELTEWEIKLQKSGNEISDDEDIDYPD